MPSSSDLDQLARRRLIRAWAAGAVLAVLVLAAILVLVRERPETTSPTAAAPTAPASTAPATPTPDSGFVAPARWTSLPEAREHTDGRYPTGWPHTPQGAAATAATMFQFVWDLDRTRAARAVEIYFAASDWAESRRDAAASTAWLREQLALPPTGETPPGATVAVQPVGVQWRTIDPDNLHVSVAMRVDVLADVAAPLQSITAVSTGHVRWHPNRRGGDWVILRTPAARMPRPVFAEPGSAAFNKAGWLAIRPGG